MKKGLAVLGMLVVVFVAWGHAGAPSPTTWSAGQTLTHSALNDTVAHIHNTLSGGITNTHISSSAAIQHSKLQTPALVPKAWAKVASACAASPCTVEAGSGVTSIARTGAGVYTVTLSYTPTNTAFGAFATTHTADLYVVVTGFATGAPQITVTCNDAAGVDTDCGFSVTVMDND